MKAFVVHHLPTGKYLPPLKSCKRATSQELSETPRIFYRERDARCAATWWAAGFSKMEYGTEWESGFEEPIGVMTYPDENRDIEDLRICDVTFTFDPSSMTRID